MIGVEVGFDGGLWRDEGLAGVVEEGGSVENVEQEREALDGHHEVGVEVVGTAVA